MKNFIQRGAVVGVPAPRNVASGELVIVGVLAGVAQHSAVSGETVEIATEGVFELPKTSAQAWTVGAAIYATPATGVCTTASSAGNLLVGAALEAAANPSAVGIVRLNGASPAAVTS